MLEALNWNFGAQESATALAAFFASLVECVEALTIVLAVGVTRDWRSALLGVGAGLGLLSLVVLIFGPLLGLMQIPLDWLQIALGSLLLIFGGKWLRKAVLRAAGLIPLHDEARLYADEVRQMKLLGKVKSRIDPIALVASFKAVVLEGMEVVFIVIAVGAAQASLVPASIGAAAAVVLITLLGLALHRPLTLVPENSLKLCVGVILASFGIFWIGEGAGVRWPGDDLAIIALVVGVLAVALSSVGLIRKMKPVG